MSSSSPVILLVEDQLIDAKLVQMGIDHCEIPVELNIVKHGKEALDYIRSNKRVDIVLLDINMPVMDGKEFLSHLREDALYSNIVVIMYTSSEDEVDIEECYTLGANCYVSKPVGMANLVELFQSMYNFWFRYARVTSTRNTLAK